MENRGFLRGKLEDGQKPHAILIPYPYQGHLTPMLKFAKLLHSKGFYITFVNNHHNHRRLLKSRGSDALNGLPSFRFESIPDGLPPSDPDKNQPAPALSIALNEYGLEPFIELIHRINKQSQDTSSIDAADQSAADGIRHVPPVSCIVADCALTFTIEASRKLGIPIAAFWTASACSLLGYFQYRRLLDMGIVPFEDLSYQTNGTLDQEIKGIAGMEGIRIKNLPSFVQITDRNDPFFNTLMDRVEKLLQYSAPIIINTYDSLEFDVIKSISTFSPPIYSIGPLNFLSEQETEHSATASASIGSNLWQEDPCCLQWLDSQQPNSVLYINFGSIAVLDHAQMIEFAWGLANSKTKFLWILRPNALAAGGSCSNQSEVLPAELMAEVGGRGMLTKWCDQEKVLGHPSIDGFVTHCGWNSTLESLSNGVAMICVPFFGDQLTNCWFCCEKWGVGIELGVEINGARFQREEVEKVVRELMEAEKGKAIKSRALKWKRLAQEAAISPDGSSSLNLDKLINQVLL